MSNAAICFQPFYYLPFRPLTLSPLNPSPIHQKDRFNSTASTKNALTIFLHRTYNPFIYRIHTVSALEISERFCSTPEQLLKGAKNKEDNTQRIAQADKEWPRHFCKARWPGGLP
jgi:hypothetical protein